MALPPLWAAAEALLHTQTGLAWVLPEPPAEVWVVVRAPLRQPVPPRQGLGAVIHTLRSI